MPELRRRICSEANQTPEELEDDNFLGKDPASTIVKHKPVDPAVHARFSARIKAIPPHKR